MTSMKEERWGTEAAEAGCSVFYVNSLEQCGVWPRCGQRGLQPSHHGVTFLPAPLRSYYPALAQHLWLTTRSDVCLKLHESWTSGRPLSGTDHFIHLMKSQRVSPVQFRGHIWQRRVIQAVIHLRHCFYCHVISELRRGPIISHII